VNEWTNPKAPLNRNLKSTKYDFGLLFVSYFSVFKDTDGKSQRDKSVEKSINIFGSTPCRYFRRHARQKIRCIICMMRRHECSTIVKNFQINPSICRRRTQHHHLRLSPSQQATTLSSRPCFSSVSLRGSTLSSLRIYCKYERDSV
jgi:hypothetical protein